MKLLLKKADPDGSRKEDAIMQYGLNLCYENSYYGHTNPGIYIGDYEKKLLFYSYEESNVGHPHNEFDSIEYIYGSYYLRRLHSDRTFEAIIYYPIPYDALDENNSISFGELVRYTEQLTKWLDCKLTDEYCQIVARRISIEHGISPDQFRYWRDDDRIAFLHPFGKTKYVISDPGTYKIFESAEDSFRIYLPFDQYFKDRNAGIIPEILYQEHRKK